MTINKLKKLEQNLSDWLHRHTKIAGIFASSVFIFLTVFISVINKHFESQKEIRDTARVIREIETNVDDLLHSSELAAITLTHAIDNNGMVHGFDSVASQILRTATYIDVLELVPQGVIEYAYPLKGNESVIGYDILEDPKVNKEAEMAIAKQEMFFAGPIDLKQGGTAVIGRLPVFRDGKFWGFSAVLIYLENLLKHAGIENEKDNEYFFQFSKIDPNSGEEKNFLQEVDGLQMWVQHEMTSFPEGQWKVHVMKPTTLGGMFITSVILIVGLLLSVLVGMVIQFHLKRGQQLAIAHRKLAWQHQEMSDSINSASYLQMSVLQDEADLKKVFPDSFVIFRPKDMVSGDFYWTFETDKHKVMAVIDCTGHGVSAALMSMMAGELLHKTIALDNERSPAKILSKMDKRLVEVLQKNEHQNSMDGMDMVLCVMEKGSNKMSFAGANRPLYLARAGQINECKGTRAAIGGHLILGKKKVFHQCELALEEGDMLYLTSDGYHSQFGGELGKTMGKKAFRYLMQSVSKLPLDKQLKHLTDDFDRWKKNEEQVDDVLVVGIRV